MVLLLIGGLFLLISGAVMAVLNFTSTDSEGYTLSSKYHVDSSAYVFMVGFNPDDNPSDTALTKWVVTATNPDNKLFVGILWSDYRDQRYFDNVKFEVPYPGYQSDWGPYFTSFTVAGTKIYNTQAPSVPPSQMNIWTDSQETSSVATIHFPRTWDNTTFGNKELVIMNADGSANVQADLQFATKVPIISVLPYVLIPTGAIVFIVGFVITKKHKTLTVSSKVEDAPPPPPPP
jgi:hypothetical protein